VLACRRKNPTAARLATAAESRTTSLTVRVGSSRVAWVAACSASIGHIVTQVQTSKVEAAPSQPTAGAYLAAPARTATTAMMTPTSSERATRRPVETPRGVLGRLDNSPAAAMPTL